MMNEVEKAWREDNRVKVKEFTEEMGTVGKCMKLRSLYEQLFAVDEEIDWRYGEYDRLKYLPYINRAFVAQPIEGLEKSQRKLEMAIRCLVYVDEKKVGRGVTPEMIIQAREYPVAQILDYQGRGNMRCIAHDDRHPSMSIKNNRVRCFACGFTGDSIEVYMTLNGCGFVEAVRALQ